MIGLLKACVLASFGAAAGLSGVSRIDGVKPLEQGAIGYYDDACAHCHGPYGSAYGEGFYHKVDLVALRSTISDMAEGPGQSPLKPADLAAQVAFHQALIEKLPFIDWTGRHGNTLSGEVSRGAKLSAKIGARAIPVDVKVTRWSLELPAGASLASLTLSATLHGKDAKWSPRRLPYSLPKTWPPKR